MAGASRFRSRSSSGDGVGGTGAAFDFLRRNACRCRGRPAALALRVQQLFRAGRYARKPEVSGGQPVDRLRRDGGRAARCRAAALPVSHRALRTCAGACHGAWLHRPAGQRVRRRTRPLRSGRRPGGGRACEDGRGAARCRASGARSGEDSHRPQAPAHGTLAREGTVDGGMDRERPRRRRRPRRRPRHRRVALCRSAPATVRTSPNYGQLPAHADRLGTNGRGQAHIRRARSVLLAGGRRARPGAPDRRGPRAAIAGGIVRRPGSATSPAMAAAPTVAGPERRRSRARHSLRACRLAGSCASPPRRAGHGTVPRGCTLGGY